MSYQSLGFLFFSAVVLLIYYVIPQKFQRYVLLAANIVFFLFAGIKYIPFILVTTLASYLVALKIGKIYAEEKQELAQCADREEKKLIRSRNKNKAKGYLTIALVITIGILAVCKYSVFVAENINKLLAIFSAVQIPTFNMILPIGISFYTFMAVGYVLDIYWKRYEAEKSLINFAVFLSYFPHVVQGPIDRYNEFRDQVKDGIAYNPKNLIYGAELVMWGLFKKLVIADRIGTFVGTVFDGEWESYRGIIILVALAGYALQIYADFSGCIDIVSGVSEAFGIKLKQNFNHPYFSRTVSEFWRRWHISLMEWFRDYLYLPMSTSRLVKNVKKRCHDKGNLRAEQVWSTTIPALVIWLTTGIWHGASWAYVSWGLYYFIVTFISLLFEPTGQKLVQKLKIKTESFGWRMFQIVRTLIISCGGRILFRAATFTAAITMTKNCFSCFGWEYIYPNIIFDYGLTLREWFVLALATFVLLVVDIIQEKVCIRDELAKKHIVIRWAVVFAGLFAIIILGTYGPGYDASAFIYEKF